jgi:hypothetical protein
MMWFEQLMGFAEANRKQVHQHLQHDGEYISSLVNGRRFRCGRLDIANISELRQPIPSSGKLAINEIVADVQQLHSDKNNANALFQAASQFNLLEMINPDTSPEAGIGIYSYDRTQGPACAIACGAGTIYRNYFVPIGKQIGQTTNNQIDCLADLQDYFGGGYWQMRNGYAFATAEQLTRLNQKINQLSPEARQQAKDCLRIGLQWQTEVTINAAGQLVSQAYCSALPVAYSTVAPVLWEPLARLILEATYEATFYAALRNYEQTGSKKLFLTLVGGGAFGNPNNWIFDALRLVFRRFATAPLDVAIVSYGRSNADLQQFLRNY